MRVFRNLLDKFVRHYLVDYILKLFIVLKILQKTHLKGLCRALVIIVVLSMFCNGVNKVPFLSFMVAVTMKCSSEFLYWSNKNKTAKRAFEIHPREDHTLSSFSNFLFGTVEYIILVEEPTTPTLGAQNQDAVIKSVCMIPTAEK